MTAAFDKAQSVKLLRSGISYFETYCRLIDEAQKSLHLQTYIFESDETGIKVIRHLLQAAGRGVRIFVLLDAYGSRQLSASHIQQLREAGITLRFFSPLHPIPWPRIGRRLHHKILVIDDMKAIIGGINISNHYSGFGGQIPWLDYALLIEGKVCRQLTRICMSLFNKKYLPFPAIPVIEATENGVSIRFRQSDYMRGKKQISTSYKEFIRRAQKEIIIVNAYFLPGYRLRRMLQKAVKRGVKISVMLSAQSDVPLVKRAMNYYYSWLFRNRIDVYEYQPTTVHAKLALFDDRFVTIGSFNLNYLSEYVSVELNADIDDRTFHTILRQEMQELFTGDCVMRINPERPRYGMLARFFDFISYQLIMYAMRFLYLVTRKDRMNILK